MSSTRLQTIEEQLGTVPKGVRVIVLHNPPMNALGGAVRQHVAAELDKAEADPTVEVVVITGAGKIFSAGADIKEFADPAKMAKPILPDLIDRVERCTKPVVAAVNGTALGGGTELALGCHFRIGTTHATFGLPEVKLGLIPGAGGTQRLPRLIGVVPAIDMCCRGGTVKAQAALKLGLVSKLVAQSELVAEAAALAKANGRRVPPRLCDDTSKLGNCIMNRIVFSKARSTLTANVPKGMLAPFKALDAVEAATWAHSFADGLKEERKLFTDCAKSPQAAALIHVFFASRRAGKVPDVPDTTPSMAVRKLGVIGGGTMGTGIAINFLNIGVEVVLLEETEARVEAATAAIRRVYDDRRNKKRLSDEEHARRMSLLKVVPKDYSALQDVDMVIEAVFENMALKKSIFAALDAACKPSCLLATNTSTLSIDEIASATKRPQQVIGTHFFSPANVMPLLEIVRGTCTSGETIQSTLRAAKAIRKQPVVVGNCFGFVSNRVMLRGGFQLMCMLEEGGRPHEIDAVVKGFGFPMGAFAMQDLAGLDVAAKIAAETPAALIPKRDVSAIQAALVRDKRYGQKTLKGWYRYDPQRPRDPIVDPEVDALIVRVGREKGIKRRDLPSREVLERYLYIMINEAALILEEGYAARPSDIDIVFIFGFGFPPQRGGLCYYADTVGLANVVKAIDAYHAALGADTFPRAAGLLRGLAAEGKKFADLNGPMDS